MANQGKSWKSYDGRDLEEGQVLVPQLVSPEYARSIGADMRNLRTWTKAGVRFTVMFVPVKEEFREITLQAFNAAVNELLDEKLGPNRSSRCLVPQADGTVRVCPKVCGGNHAPCASCPHRGMYAREDRSVLSLDALEEDEFLPAEAVSSAETEAMLGILLDELIAVMGKKNPLFAEVVRLGYQGMDRKKIVDRLALKKSQGYEVYRKCLEEVRRWLG